MTAAAAAPPTFVPDVRVGDCVALMGQMPAGSVDAVVTDPPYELDFMGKGWDRSGVAFRPATWREALRVTAPGGHLAAFGGTRTFHRLAVAIEDAGWEIRDCVLWLYGQGMPKSHNGEHGGTGLKPAWEPIILARKPLDGTVAANHDRHGTGGLNIDACRVGATGGTGSTGEPNRKNQVYGAGMGGLPAIALDAGRWPANVTMDGEAAAQLDAQHPTTRSKRTVGARAGKDVGTFGAYEGQAQVAMGHDDAGGPSRYFYCAKASRAEREAGLESLPLQAFVQGYHSNPDSCPNRPGDLGFNIVKQRRNIHPTVKPIALMRWLARLITPPGGLILDPFTGSGSTGCAAVLEGFDFIGLELLEAHADIARRRTIYWQSRPERPLTRRTPRAPKKAPTGADALLLRAKEVLAR